MSRKMDCDRRWIRAWRLCVYAASALLLISPAAMAHPAKRLIKELEKSLTPMQSFPARAEGDSIVVEAKGLPQDHVGALLAVTGKDGAQVGVARITGVNPDSAICRGWIGKGATWPAGPLRAQGFRRPARALVIFQAPQGSNAALWQGALLKSAEESGFLSAIREDISYLFAGSSPERLAQAASARRADLIILPFLRTVGGMEEYGFSLLDAQGAKLAAFTAGSSPQQGEEVSGQAAESAKREEPKAPQEAGARPAGFLAQLKSPARAERVGPEPAAVTAEEDVDLWDAVRVDGRALSAALYYVGGIVARDLAILTADRLILAGVGGDGGLKTKWISPPFAGSTPLSLAVFDTNGDGREEIFVNAIRSGGFRSMLFDDSGKGYRMMAGDLPYYFSNTPGWRLLAQRMAPGGKVEKEFYRVTREEGDLRMDPAGVIEGEAPLGLYGFDPDEDGLMELAGALGDGTVIIFSETGKLLWSAGGLAGGGKKIVGNGSGGEKLPLGPRLVPLKDKGGRPMLGVGMTDEVEGGFLGAGAKSSGLARMIRIRPDGYATEKILIARRAWLSDLTDMGGGLLGTNSHPGYVAINEEEGNSVIYIPMETDEAAPKPASSGSFGAPSPPARDQE